MKVRSNNYWSRRSALSVPYLADTRTVIFNGQVTDSIIYLFEAQGDSLVSVLVTCSADLTGSGATLEIGIPGSTAKFIPQMTATNFDAGDIADITGEVTAGTAPVISATQVLFDGQTINLKVGTAAIETGTIKVYVFARELDPYASVAPIVESVEGSPSSSASRSPSVSPSSSPSRSPSSSASVSPSSSPSSSPSGSPSVSPSVSPSSSNSASISESVSESSSPSVSPSSSPSSSTST